MARQHLNASSWHYDIPIKWRQLISWFGQAISNPYLYNLKAITSIVQGQDVNRFSSSSPQIGGKGATLRRSTNIRICRSISRFSIYCVWWEVKSWNGYPSNSAILLTNDFSRKNWFFMGIRTLKSFNLNLG